MERPSSSWARVSLTAAYAAVLCCRPIDLPAAAAATAVAARPPAIDDSLTLTLTLSLSPSLSHPLSLARSPTHNLVLLLRRPSPGPKETPPSCASRRPGWAARSRPFANS
ncbi:hypothetical protein CDD83_6775 [Cordyceps sp. RAO-2017]|nr:hypothetical protein CDD83_6775 [Cordyceps sp. RAO-2017]